MSDEKDNVIPLRLPPAGLVALSDLVEEPPMQPWYSGFPEWRKKIAVAAGTLSVCTGHPGNGKTSLMGNLWFNTASTQNLHVVIATFETRPLPAYRKMLRQYWAALPQHQMTDDQIKQADEWIHDHYRFLIHPKQRPTLAWVFDWALAAGNEPDVLIMDPWNRIESQRNQGETETEYTASCLTDCLNFAQEKRCHVQIIAHPAKREMRYRDHPPTLEDVSGSKHWDNMPDQGFSVHREKFYDPETKQRRWDATLYHLKSRFEELGYPCSIDMRLNPQTWRFETVDAP